MNCFPTFHLAGTADSRRHSWAGDFHVCSSTAPCSWPYCGTYTPVSSSFTQPVFFVFVCLAHSVCQAFMLDTSFSAKMFLHTFESQTHQRTRCEPHSLSFPEKDPYSHLAKDFSRAHEHPAVYEQPAPDCKHLESRVCVLFYFIPCTQQRTWSTETKSVSVNWNSMTNQVHYNLM